MHVNYGCDFVLGSLLSQQCLKIKIKKGKHVILQDEEKRRQAQAEWGQVFCSLQSLLRTAAKICVKNGAMSEDCSRKYFMSGEHQRGDNFLDG